MRVATVLRGPGSKVVCAVLGIAAIATPLVVRERDAAGRCRDAMERTDWHQAVAHCAAAHGETGDDAIGLLLATAHMYVGDMAAAEAVARHLLAGSARGGALRTLGIAARQRQEPVIAAVLITSALAVDAAAGDRLEMMRDSNALSALWRKEGALDAALAAADASRDLATEAGDRRGQGSAEVGRSDIFRMLGDDVAAEDALAAAATVLTGRCDRSWVLLKQGQVRMSLGHHALADDAMREALASATACGQRQVVAAVHHNLAWLARPSGREADALQHLAIAGVDAVEAVILRALFAADRGDLVGAGALLAIAAAQVAPDAEWPWLIAVLQAEVAEAAGRDDDAEVAYRRAIALAAALRARTSSSAPYVIASHRSASEGLFALLARAGRWRDALAVIVDLDAHDLLRTTAAAGGVGPSGIQRAAGVASGAVALTPSDEAVTVDDVLAAWRDRDLVVLVATGPRAVKPGGERVWRLRVRSGTVSGEDAGDARAAASLADRLLADVGDVAAAEALGAVVVPAEPSTAPLFVLPLGRLGIAPLAALRRDGALVLEQRPLVRVLGVRPRRETPPPRRGAVVLGDPRRDLAKAQDEARAVAWLLATTAAVADHATTSALFAGASAAVLHLATHSDDRGRRIVLHLADGDVGADELLRAGMAPELAVLASCGSAAARDEESWGSLAAAFLAGGTERVVATQWSVLDAAAADVVRAFYDAYVGAGFTEPERALAAAQVALARSSPGSDWAAFTILASPPVRATPHATR